jgi:hypothetical protein
MNDTLKVAEGGHPRIMSTRLLISLKWGIVACPPKWTLKCRDLFSWDPSLDHCGAAPMMSWIVSLSVGLSSILGLTYS